jgi:hypothetical protein
MTRDRLLSMQQDPVSLMPSLGITLARILFRLPLYRWRVRVLELEPVDGAT